MNSFFRQAGRSAIAHALAWTLAALCCVLDAFAGPPTGNSPPSVGIAVPANGTTLRGASVNIPLVALAYDSDGIVTQVQFLNGTTPIGTVTASPWQITWTNVPPGTYSITAKATDNATSPATTTSSPITITVLPTSTQPPQGVLTSPLNCAVFDMPATVVFKADAYADNGIQLVEFLANNQVKGSTTTAPYQFTWNNPPGGTYQLAVRVKDNAGLITTSPSISVTVNAPPSVTLTSPAAGTFSSPYNMQFAATASDDVRVDHLEFVVNNQVKATLTAPPYQYTWTNVPAGTYDVWARAFDDRQLAGYSIIRRVVINANQAPTVQITAPTNNTTVDAPASFTLTATANDPDGTINQVEFYRDGVRLGAGTLAGGVYTFPWSGVGPGVYMLTAIATDNLGAQTTSAQVKVTVAVHTDTGETLVFLHNDTAGNAIAATDTTGAILWKENYRPFGDRLVKDPAATSNRQWFAGKAADADTGLSYFGARYYDPVVGRFMGVDAAQFQDRDLHSFNRYGYARNNPYRYVDPDGHSPLDIVFLVYDIGNVGYSIYKGEGVHEAIIGLGLSAVGVISPVPGVGLVLKAERAAHAAEGAAHAVSAVRGAEASAETVKIAAPYTRPSGATTRAQRESVQGKPCVDCGATTERQVADHKDPLVKEYYRTGGIDKERMRSVDSVQSQCPTCSAKQGAELSRYSREMKKEHNLE